MRTTHRGKAFGARPHSKAGRRPGNGPRRENALERGLDHVDGVMSKQFRNLLKFQLRSWAIVVPALVLLMLVAKYPAVLVLIVGLVAVRFHLRRKGNRPDAHVAPGVAPAPPRAAVASCPAHPRPLAAHGRSVLTQMRHQALGAGAERTVQAAISRTPGVHAALYDVDLGQNGDADAVVISRYGVACVEVKSGGGVVRVRADGAIITGQGRAIPGNPVRQVELQAGLVQRALGVPVGRIVVIEHMTNATLFVGDVAVCSPQALGSILARLPGPPIDGRQARQMATRLSRAAA